MPSTVPAPGHRPWWPALRGLATAVAASAGSVLLGWLTVAVTLALVGEPCGPEDLACFSGLFAVGAGLFAGLIGVAVLGPVLGRLLRAPRPSWFWPPAAWLLVAVVAWLGPAASSAWLIAVVLVSLLGYPITMVVVSVRMEHHRHD